MTADRVPSDASQAPGEADAPMPAAVAPDGDDRSAQDSDARIDDAVTQHSATPVPRPPHDRDLPPRPPGEPTDAKS